MFSIKKSEKIFLALIVLVLMIVFIPSLLSWLEVSQPQNSAWINNPLADTAGAFSIGVGNMLNDTVVGGTGYLLGNIGRGVEAISPYSGRDYAMVNKLLRAGYSLDEIEQEYNPHEDSWITSGAKGVLSAHNAIEDYLDRFWRLLRKSI